MAEFEDNPFADPKQINPFADPSVQQASEPQPSTEEYNPFAEEVAKDPEPPRLPPPPTKPQSKKKEKKQKPQGPKRPQFSEPPPAVLQPEPPPSYEPAPPVFPGTDENSHLTKREEELSRREAELRDRERNLQKLGTEARPKNFPPLPKFCPCQPCFYVNISEEIPPGERWKIRLLVVTLIYYFILLVLNLIMSFPGLIAFGPLKMGISNPQFTTVMAILTIVFGFVLLLLCPVMALFCWFFPVYRAYRKDSSLSFMWFFFVLPAQCLFWLILALGIGGFNCGFIGGAGILNYQNGGDVIGGIWIAMGFLWLIPIPSSIVLVVLIHRYYRTSGGSINRAVGEAATGAAQNEAVRGAVKSTVKAGVSAAMEQ